MKVTNYFLNFDFGGRARRSHYWANLACWIGALLVFAVIGMAVAPEPEGGASGVLSLLLGVGVVGAMVDNMAMVFRRAHDTGKSGWIWLLLLIPLINLLPFYWLMIEDSQQGPNKYGPPVKQFYQAPAATA
ncbi:DUF805 domain-containing protein [Phenylobacterium sp. J426]|uniref:DUF805 domain-containing protein n=1 Tax=Phenylobacterium sp. J426 TaxID=2898439 RepID=UPI002151F097|nr:DUF805 domain-containing protein [Phenylobacterium sp. J426]MCR5875134.1 DUF805 domain-containing protein [Phenylobacterium sp. J426]